tara:strand:+ start:35650 stop:41955 length:6306 start_codon:yes stop_codon:yes gene_type:complete
MIDGKINLHYWPGMAGKKNFGDEMSAYIMKKLLPFNDFTYNEHSKNHNINLIALGSYIQMAQDDYYVFGSGVRKLNDRVNYESLNVIAVRGPKSRDFLISKGIDCPEIYGDPGLFISRYYQPKIDPHLSSKIGIVPHITDNTNYNHDGSGKFYIIDPCQDWRQVIDQICSCKSIVSSSLHGLICADAYGVPNLWLQYEFLDEGDFKFLDYFLSQGREINKIKKLNEIEDSKFYKKGNNINLDILSDALYESKINKKEKKIAIVYNIPKDNKEKYKKWKDGFTEAIKLLSSIYKISMVNINDGIIDFDDFDWVFVKEGFGGNIFPAIEARIKNCRKGIFISASNSKPSDSQLDKFDLMFYETLWYAEHANLKNNPKAFHAFGIDSGSMRPSLRPKKDIDCLFVGSIVGYKRPWEILKYEGRKVCVGAIENKDIKKYLTDRGAEIMDFISYEKLSGLYNSAKKCLVPCETHGGGERSVLEARACGIEVEILEDNEKLKELKNGKILDHFDYSKSIYDAMENFKIQEKICLINPTSINFKNQEYVLYRGEEYMSGKPPPSGFNRSNFTYWLECGGRFKQCSFNVKNIRYKSARRIDIDKKSGKSIIEDLRFIDCSARETDSGIIVLATCSMIPYTRIFKGSKKADGNWDENKPIGLELDFHAAYCEVNLTTAEIKFLGIIDNDTQSQLEKNWTCFIHENEFYVIRMIDPLVYSRAGSISDISFKGQDVDQVMNFSCSTNPIKISKNKYVMLCHKRNKDKKFEYCYKLVTFEIFEGQIKNLTKTPIRVPDGVYCSSIKLVGNKIKVFAGVKDLDHTTFYLDAPKEESVNHMNINFPNITEILHKQIPKKVHLSWKNKDILNSNYELIKKGPKNLELLNPDWDIEVYDDDDINKLLRDTIGKNNWNLIKDRKITEKTDLWRLIKTYQEGGLYIDIDRYIDTPLSEIINKKTAMFLPTFQDIDFSQDFILTCPKNPMIGKAIANNLNYRLKDESLFFLAVQSYMHSVSEVLTGKAVDRGNNPEYFNNIRNRIDSCEHLETFREIGPEYHTLYRNLAGDFNAKIFEKDKADFYNGESVIHWNTDTQEKHIEFKNTNKQKIHDIALINRKYDVCFCCDENLIRYAINPINAICEKNTDNNIVIHFIYSGKESDLCYIENVLVDKSNVTFKKYIVDSLNISINQTWRSIEHLSSATNLKLQIPEILKDIDKVIYFDIDTIPYVNLGEFDKIKTNVCGIAMRQEIKNGWRTFNGSKGTVTENKNPVDFGDRVIGNSGVMVLDLVELRQNNFTEFCLNEKRENNYNIPLTGGDQDLINIFCKCYFDELPDKLNILVSDQLIGVDGGKFKFKKFTRSTNQGLHLLKNEGEESSDGGVLHFIGKDKPWNSDCLGYKFWSEFNTNSPKIPKKIFQTWKTKDLNDGLTLLSKSFREKNPGYEYFLYDDDDCRKLIEENFEPVVLEVYDRIIPGAFKADLWRYCALYIEGGIFCDMDMICMKSFDSIINDDIEFFAPIDSNSRGAHDLYNAFMGSAPGHPILKSCIDTIVDNVINETWRKNKQPPLDFSACGVLGRCVNKYIGREDFSSFTGQMGVHDSVKVLNYVKEHRYVEDKESNKYVWSKDGNKKIKMIVRQAEKEYKAEPWILSVAGGKIPYKQKQSINFYEENPEKIVDYFGIDCQLTNKSLSSIVREIKDKKCNCNMLVFGLGKDSIIYDTVNKGYTLFLETNQAWIDLNQNIKNKILYTFQTTVKDSLPINKEYLNKFDIPDFIVKTKWDIILVDAPPGDRVEAPGRALPIYWSSQIAKKHQTTIFIDDCCRDLEKKYCDRFFPEIHFNVKSDTERGDFRVYKQKQSNILIHQHLETKQQQFIKVKDQWKNFKDYDFLKYISNQIPETQTPRDKFTTYNSGNKIAIVSLYTPEISDYAIHSENSIRDYCEKQNYTFYVYRQKLEENCSANWSKAQAILRHINDHDYIVWMDSDTLIFNDEKKFEDIISKASRKFIFATKDIGDNSMLNSGVLIFKNHDYVKGLIKKWRDFDGDKTSLYASGGDQEILCDILKKSDGFGFNRKIFEMNEFNTDPRFVDEDTFILHFMAYPHELKKIFMSYWQNNFLTEPL